MNWAACTDPSVAGRLRGIGAREPMQRICVIFLLFAAVLPVAARSEIPADQVVLLHGLGRSSRSMKPLESKLLDAGYVVHNIEYSSTKGTPEQLLRSVTTSIEECCSQSVGRLHFVTHSLGGILVRAYLARHRPENLGRVVLLAPPNSGSEIVDTVGGNALFSEILGPAGQDLGTDPNSFPNRLPPPRFRGRRNRWEP